MGKLRDSPSCVIRTHITSATCDSGTSTTSLSRLGGVTSLLVKVGKCTAISNRTRPITCTSLLRRSK